MGEYLKFFSGCFLKIADSLVSYSFFDWFYPDCLTFLIIPKKCAAEKSSGMNAFSFNLSWWRSVWITWWSIQYLGSLKVTIHEQNNFITLPYSRVVMSVNLNLTIIRMWYLKIYHLIFQLMIIAWHYSIAKISSLWELYKYLEHKLKLTSIAEK